MAEKATHSEVPPQGPLFQDLPQAPPPYTPIAAPPGPGHTQIIPYVAANQTYYNPPIVRAPTAPTVTPYYNPPIVRAPAAPAASPKVVIKLSKWGPFPTQVVCKNCGAHVMTQTDTTPGSLACLFAIALFVCGCPLGCCLIPCCIPQCLDVDHRCPNCKEYLGTFHRL